MRFNASGLPNGTVLLMGVGYKGAQPGGDTRGRQTPKVYTYGALKAGGLWYMTGMGDVPQAAGWPVVERWLAKKDRTLVWVKGTTDNAMATLWESSPEEPEQPTGRKYERDLDDEVDGIPDVHGNYS